VQLAAGVNAIVGHANLLDFFEIEQARAVRKGVQGHDADSRGVGVEKGERDHGRLRNVDRWS
jgi:hypothetical protein